MIEVAHQQSQSKIHSPRRPIPRWIQEAFLLLAMVSYIFEPLTQQRGCDANGQTTSYDLTNRLLTETVVPQTGSTVTTTYTYDNANNRSSRAITGNATPGTNTYTYNNLNQLTGVTGLLTASYTYDSNGNRLTETSNGATDSYSYDIENRLIGLTKAIPGTGFNLGTYAYTYDYRTRRIVRDETGTTGGQKTLLVFSGGTSVQEYPTATTNTVNVEYVRGSDYGGGVGGVLYTIRNGVDSFTHENRRGDVVSKTNGSGVVTYQATYEAFGKRTQETGRTLDRQKGNTKDEDPTGLLDEGFRYRDLDSGTFVTRDPLGFVDGPNMYSYVVDNPWTHFDPEGLQEAEPSEEVDPNETAREIAPVRPGQPAGPLTEGDEQESRVIMNLRPANAGPPQTSLSANPEVENEPASGRQENSSGSSGKTFLQKLRDSVNGLGQKVGVKPYEVDTKENLDKRALPNDGLSHDHQPSYASLVRQFEIKNGREPSDEEAKEIYKNGMSMAIPTNLHQTASPTYGGRNNSELQDQDARDPVGAAKRDSQAQVAAAKPEDKDAAQAAAIKIQRAAQTPVQSQRDVQTGQGP